MSRSKKVFAAFALVFALILGYVVYDISTRTTFPGSRPSTEDGSPPVIRDSVVVDTTRQ